MLEIIALSVEDAKIIEASGGDRIELVSAISEGGLTPSYGMIESVVEAVDIPVNVMIRPHGFNFEYNDYDLEVMKKDIKIIESLGASGIVLGVLKEKKADLKVLEELIDTDLNVTFHRAIDETQVLESYKSISSVKKINQILTSGGPGKAADNMEFIKELYEYCPEKLLIGSGVTLNNLPYLLEAFPRANFHVGSDARVNQTFGNRIDEKHIRLMVKLIRDGKM